MKVLLHPVNRTKINVMKVTIFRSHKGSVGGGQCGSIFTCIHLLDWSGFDNIPHQGT